MKAKVNVDGVLTVYPETENEEYILKKWSDGYESNGDQCESVLSVVCSVRDIEHTEK